MPRPRKRGGRRGGGKRGGRKGGMAFSNPGPLDRKSRPPPVTYAHAQRNGNLMVLGKRNLTKVLKGRVNLGRRNNKKRNRMNLGMRVRDPVINLHFRFKIASLGFDAAGAPTFLCGPLLTTEFMGQLYLQLPNSFYFPSMVTNMARNFEYWRLPRFKLLWRTRLGTTSQSFLHCAFFSRS